MMCNIRPHHVLATCCFSSCDADLQGLSVDEYESRKAEAAQKLIDRLDAVFPGLASSVEFAEVSDAPAGPPERESVQYLQEHRQTRAATTAVPHVCIC
jgi:hypothetical protein